MLKKNWFLFGLAATSWWLAACDPPHRGFQKPIGHDASASDPTGDDGGDDSGAATLGCTGDLRNVVDENGVVVQTCDPDQGCAAGQCIAACDAAGLSQGSIGCDYQIATPSFYSGSKPPCFAVFVANAWAKSANLMVQRGAMSYNVASFARIPVAGQPASSWQPLPTGGLPPGQVAIVFLSQDPQSKNGSTPLTCPISPAANLSGGTAVLGTGRGQAWHVSADVPVTMYDILPYGGASSYLPSAELLFPTTAWGTNYFGIVPIRGTGNSSITGAQWGQIVAASDNTTVTLLPSVPLPGGNQVLAAATHTPITYNLNAGEYIQWQDTEEMSSTVIQADHPIAFTGGQTYQCYQSTTSTGGGCDSGHQQVPAVSAFAWEYAVAPYTTRRRDLQPESIKYRIVGAVKDTALLFVPVVAGAPLSLGVGQVVDFEATGPFVVRSQDSAHPFYVAQTMSGCFVTGGSRAGDFGSCLGDEDFVNVLPPAQFLTQYVFFTDPTYRTTNLVFTRVKTANGFQDVTLDCIGTVTGWRPMGSSGVYEFADVDLIRVNVKGKCDNGPHVASSPATFGVTVWGLDNASSYGYPAGGNVAPINQVIVLPMPG